MVRAAAARRRRTQQQERGEQPEYFPRDHRGHDEASGRQRHEQGHTHRIAMHLVAKGGMT